jgi:hypothetical protein
VSVLELHAIDALGHPGYSRQQCIAAVCSSSLGSSDSGCRSSGGGSCRCGSLRDRQLHGPSSSSVVGRGCFMQLVPELSKLV